MATKIYTRTGDQGQTGLFGGPRVAKSDPRLDAYGTLDELNATLGLVRSDLAATAALAPLNQALEDIQNELFNLGSHLAVGEEALRQHLPALRPQSVQTLESSIDAWSAELPALKEFILPGGTRVAALLHLARTVCRRAERLIVGLKQTPVNHEQIVIYMNRLSDFLFVAARWANHQSRHADVTWRKPQGP